MTAIQQIHFSEIRMHGVVAKRRTAHFGVTYDFQTFQLSAAAEIPSFLSPIRDRAARLGGVAATEFREALVTEYSAGSGIGWHRDAPQFGVIVGISLLSSCTMQFRPWPVADPSTTTKRRVRSVSRQLAPRSAYLIAGVAREKWQHRIPATNSLRYSITFRTLSVRNTR